ncbi:MAG: HlyC/CorC family transporter [Ruminococcus sp.]|nr:HlyC/CorC family transporter [Ruminococcus sp.]
MDIFIIAVLLILSAVCSATETAFSSVNHIRLKNYAAEGNKSAKRALWISEHFDKALTCILIGNNVVNIASSALATVIFTEKFGSGSVGLATLVMTVLVLIFGEILPKSLAKENAESFSLFMALPLRIAMVLLSPLIWIFTNIKNAVTRLFGSHEKEPSVTEEELKVIIDEIEDEGVLEEQESELVRSALEFDETSVSEILVPRINITGVDIHESPENIRRVFAQSRYSRLPVFDGTIDKIEGILLQSDFYESYLENKCAGGIGSIMTAPIYLSETQPISEAMRQMQRKKVHLAVVVDQYGGTEGLVTLEDIIEELVGEIYDESDVEDTSFVRLSDDSFDISAELSVGDFLEKACLDDDMIHTDMNSMGGYLMELCGHVPVMKEKITAPPFEFTAIMEGEQRIDRILVTVLRDEKDGEEGSGQ